MTRRPIIGLGAVAVAVTIALVFVLGSAPATPPPGSPAADARLGAARRADRAPPRARPSAPSRATRSFGFVPYWEMNDGIAEHLARTPLTTLALFSVTHTKDGAIDTKQTGYKRITGAIGEQLIREAHDRGIAVQLVYTSFGHGRERAALRLGRASRTRRSTALVALADEIGVDGINVDVEQIDLELVPAYGAFVGRLRDALRAAMPDGAGLGRDERRADRRGDGRLPRRRPAPTGSS